MLVQKLRLQRGWSQQQLADLSGVSVRTIQRLEQGKGASVETLKSLAAVFEIDFSQLMPEQTMDQAPTPYRNTDEALAFYEVRKIRAFYVHLFQFLVVIAGLTIINLATSPHYLWVKWTALGWGIGVLAHAVMAFNLLPIFGPAWEKRQVEARLGRKL